MTAARQSPGAASAEAAVILADLRRIDNAHMSGTRADIETWSAESRERISVALETFAARKVAEAVAAERERCAKTTDNFACGNCATIRIIAAAIRAAL